MLLVILGSFRYSNNCIVGYVLCHHITTLQNEEHDKDDNEIGNNMDSKQDYIIDSKMVNENINMYFIIRQRDIKKQVYHFFSKLLTANNINQHNFSNSIFDVYLKRRVINGYYNVHRKRIEAILQIEDRAERNTLLEQLRKDRNNAFGNFKQ